MSDPKPCSDCFNNFHNNEYSPCDENLMVEYCKTLAEWKKRQEQKRLDANQNNKKEGEIDNGKKD